MHLTARTLLFGVLTLALVGLFLSLGIWQLGRLDERRAANEARRDRLERPPLRLGATASEGLRAPSLPDAERVAWRRVVATGRMDYEHEVVLAPRSFGEGTPGVYLLTPLLLPDGAMVPVLRGSLPAPDGFHAPLERARPAGWKAGGSAAGDGPREEGGEGPGEGDVTAGREPGSGSLTVLGVALPLPTEAGASTSGGTSAAAPREDVAATERDGEGGTRDTLHTAVGVHPVLARLEREGLERVLPHPVPGFYLRADSTTERIPPSDGVRLPAPVPAGALDDGPHLFYALQWFSFAVITLVGGVLFLRSGGASATE